MQRVSNNRQKLRKEWLAELELELEEVGQEGQAWEELWEVEVEDDRMQNIEDSN